MLGLSDKYNGDHSYLVNIDANSRGHHDDRQHICFENLADVTDDSCEYPSENVNQYAHYETLCQLFCSLLKYSSCSNRSNTFDLRITSMRMDAVNDCSKSIAIEMMLMKFTTRQKKLDNLDRFLSRAR